jgi:hypothetical protein
VKKPKIKLTTSSTPKANGAGTPKSASKGQSDAKGSKSKPKKAKEAEEKVDKEVLTPKEPELTPAEKSARKEVSARCLHFPVERRWI